VVDAWLAAAPVLLGGGLGAGGRRSVPDVADGSVVPYWTDLLREVRAPAPERASRARQSSTDCSTKPPCEGYAPSRIARKNLVRNSGL
jgi:hypothetical protein